MGRNTAYLSAKEAIARLGVKPATLYAYVSRGQVRCEAKPGTKKKLYLRADIDRLVLRSRARSGRGAVAAEALRWGEPVLDSAVTLIQGGMLYYRGHELSALVRAGTSFEQTAELLWSGALPLAPPVWPAASCPVTPARVAAAPWTTRAAHALLDAGTLGTSGSETIDETMTLARHFTSRLARMAETRGGKASRRPAAASSCAATMLWTAGVRTSDAMVQCCNTALVVSADHELNASTFAARVIASTNAGLTACLLGALGALSGPRHGATTVAIETMLRSWSSPRDARPAARALAQAGRAVPGFGHYLYPDGDPRYAPLMAHARACQPHSAGAQTLARVEALVEAMAGLGGDPPSVDLALVAARAALDLPDGAALALFGLGRMAGWVAHILEQRQQDSMLRPRARYTGRQPKLLDPTGTD